ncbi:cytochrome-c peroxidase [Spirosoma luteolum]
MLAPLPLPTASIPVRFRPGLWPLVAGLAAVWLLIGLYGLLRPTPAPADRVQQQYVTDVAALDSAARTLHRALQGNRPAGEVQAALRRTRLAYKRAEWLTEVFTPETAKSINGPNLAEIDEVDRREEAPEGLQVLEEGLFPYDPANRDVLTHQAAVLVSNIGRLRQAAATSSFTDSHIFDAMRLEVFRVITLGITGFDSPVAHLSLPEAAEALTRLRETTRLYALADHDAALDSRLDQTFARADSVLRQGGDFDRFDRLGFITQQANVLSGLLLDAQRTLAIPVFDEHRFLSPAARTLNDPAAFDPAHFVSTHADRPTPARVALGKTLFFDPVLSGRGQRTCASCHQPGRAFTDGEPTSRTAAGTGRIRRNAPTLLNAALQGAQFMDLRVTFLEDQVADVIRNPAEMHGSLPDAVRALRQQPDYRRQFARAYAEGVTERTVTNALASYIRSLTSLDSRVDRYLRTGGGQPALLTSQEQQGFNLFMGKAQCATCHFFPLFNGTVPPGFAKTESEVLGVPTGPGSRRLDPDLGRYEATRMAGHRHAFKTPTVRHVAQTAPYMHQGTYQTLEQVVDFYNRGGGVGLGYAVPNQTLPDGPLHLSKLEQAALVAFLKAL